MACVKSKAGVKSWTWRWRGVLEGGLAETAASHRVSGLSPEASASDYEDALSTGSAA